MSSEANKAAFAGFLGRFEGFDRTTWREDLRKPEAGPSADKQYLGPWHRHCTQRADR
jgi:hypothetical protein